MSDYEFITTESLDDGQIVRIPADGISVIGRNTQGVRCISLREGDRLVSCALVPSEEPTTETAESS